ncbi:MAG: rRNA pseudouridine synthase [Bacilli bacterium]|nr:rRNA pseudouridine synthase [Bacilli bacterium]
MERLQKQISALGYCSRRKAEELIVKGLVKVNGEVVTELGTKVDPNDVIEVEGNTLTKQEKEYYVFNKPREVVSTTSDDKGRKTILDYFDIDTRIYPIGRLDYDTTGIILLTNDGEFANLMMKPSSNIKKVYLAKINGILSLEEMNTLKKGIKVKGVSYYIDRIKVKKIDKAKNTSMVEITIHEGKNHEIKKIFEYLNYDVLKLTRLSYGSISLGDLPSGKYRKLSIHEVKTLYSLIKK